MGHYYHFKAPPYKALGRTAEKPGRHPHNQGTTVTVITHGTHWHSYCWEDAVKTQWHFLMFLPWKHDHLLIMRKHLTNPNWDTFYKITGPTSSKVSRSWKSRKTCFRLKDTKENNLIESPHSVPDDFTRKDIIGRSGKSWVGSEDWRIVRYQC